MDEGGDRFSFVWKGLDAPRMEFATVTVGEDGLRASGEQIGVGGGPYHVRYTVTTGPDHIFRTFLGSSTRGDGASHLFVFRESDGIWRSKTWSTTASGEDSFDFDISSLAGALDLDLGFSPLFNSWPVLRDGLHEDGAGSRDYLMGWVAVPELTLTSSRQRYEPLGRRGDLRIVRFSSLDSGFTADIAFDGDGFVVEYPDFLRRIAAARTRLS